MVTTCEIIPSPILAPFIRCYSFRAFDTRGLDLLRPLHASLEIRLIFFLTKTPLLLIDPLTGKILKKVTGAGVIGLGTRYNGDMLFNGCYSIFEIIFRPNGFYKIFGLSANAFTNNIMNADEVLGSSIAVFFEKLNKLKTLPEMGGFSNEYLESCLQKQKPVNGKSPITQISNLILKNPEHIHIDQAASEANMSIRNFERRFTRQVGMPPKLFCCVSRFNFALRLKLKNLKKGWASIAVESGYYDQNHLIKDFIRFSGSPPAAFLGRTTLMQETEPKWVEAYIKDVVFLLSFLLILF